MQINSKELINNTIVLAICGKSAAGKDSLACWLQDYLKRCHMPINRVKSDTTRPKRFGEHDNVEYTFISDNAFKQRILQGYYLEYTNFKGWYYGIPKDNIQEGTINIAVVNPRGLESFSKMQHQYTVIPIYLSAPALVRLRRSIEREKTIRWEYFRRLIADAHDFSSIRTILSGFHHKIIFDKHEMGILKQSFIIECYLKSILGKTQ